ncbi:MAG TPA: LysM peptidoglycan-binding domain-containing protein [Drouetiella sp.]
MSRFAFNPEMNAGNIAPSGGEAAATTGIDLHRATVFTPGIESHAAAAVPGAEQGIMSAVQAASQPISPLIQMIMRMPGQIGLFSSMFEALGNFLLGHADVLTSAFDPSILSNFHNALTSLPTGEHMGFSLSLLPGDAPFLHGLTNLNGGGGADFLNVAKNTAQGFNTHDILKDSIAFRDSLKVSGGLDLNKPQFEMGRMGGQADGMAKGEALSGPAMREAGSATHLAGANRLFGDRPVALTSHSPLANPTTSVASAPNAPVSSAVANSMNVSGSGLQAETASMDMSQTVSGSNINQVGDAGTTSSVGPSGAVGDNIGGKNLLAMDRGASGYQPDAHAAGGYDANYLQQQTPSADSHNLGGMKAQALSLDGMSHAAKSHMTSAASHASGAASPTHVSSSSHTAPTHTGNSAGDSLSHAKPEHVAHKSVMDHIGHQTNGVHHHVGAGHDSIAHVNKPGTAAEAPGASAEPQAAADGSQVTDGTQIAQATDATQPPAAGDAATTDAPATTTYTIRAGDNLWNIAKDHLGSGMKWSELYKMNADVLGSNPALIQPGTNIQLPGDPSNIASAGAEHGSYIVKAGDNLWNIEKGISGDGSKWGEIYNLNKDVIGANPSLIRPGMELHMPGASGETAGTLAQAPTAAASQQLASVPQAAAPTAPTPAMGSDLRMEGGSPIAADGTVAQAPIQTYSPSEMQAAAAPAAQGTEMPLLPEQAAMAPAAPPAHAGGPGAAAAAELGPQPTPAELHAMAKNNDIVSSKLGADLSSFLRKKS